MRAPEILTTLAILTKSSRSSALNASGLSGRGSMPCLARRSRIRGSLSSVAIAALSWSTTAFGMPAGPSRPSQESNSYPAAPLSARVGSSGRNRERLAGDHFVDRLGGRLERHVHHVQAGEARQVRHRQVRRAAVARRSVVEF